MSVWAWALSMLSVGPSTLQPLISHHPRVSAGHGGNGGGFGWASSNWSGYAVTGGAPYTAVTASWVVPVVQPAPGSTYSSAWVGIDGFNNSDLIQTGTEQDFYAGSAHYSAWWEILPASETVINTMTVAPGDVMIASISRGGTGAWTISLRDVSNGQAFTTAQSYTGPLTSAEWILEAPTVGGRIATLASYGQTTFDPGTANGASTGLTSANGGVMIQRRAQISTPSPPDSDVDGFNVAYGSRSPAAPSS